jgi:heterodisulfide reductase subunit A
MNEPELATLKAKDLVRMGVAKARELTPLNRLPIEINPDALVIGGGLAGMTSALALADAGFKTHLIEKETELGGNMRNIYFNFDHDPQKLLADNIQKLHDHPLIEVHTDTVINNIEGYIGNYKTTYSKTNDKEQKEFEHGVVIVATGAVEHETQEYHYGDTSRIVTQVEFEQMLHEQKFPTPKPKNVVMIQCVGSREEGRMYCSRVCCTKAVKNALNLKKKLPNANIYIAYRDIRTYGFREKYYTQLRDQGAMFVHYTPENKPQVNLEDEFDPDSKVNVTIFDPIMDKEVEVDADFLVLATAIDARPENVDLAKMLKISLNTDGMFLEAHVKLRPVDFATEGVFVAGLAHNPKDMDESITQAKAAASRAITYLSKKSILAEGTITEVNESRCSGCGYCEAICAYNAIKIDPEKEVAVINEALCKGCGACVASCRCAALNLRGFSNEQLFSVFESLDMTDIIGGN